MYQHYSTSSYPHADKTPAHSHAVLTLEVLYDGHGPHDSVGSVEGSVAVAL